MSAPDPHRWRAIPAAKSKRAGSSLLFFAFGGLLIVLALLIAILISGA